MTICKDKSCLLENEIRHVVFVPGLLGARVSRRLTKQLEQEFNDDICLFPYPANVDEEGTNMENNNENDNEIDDKKSNNQKRTKRTKMKRTMVKVVDVNPGPLSSVHDRAREVFYQLYGGTVDYGEEHSCEHGHSRFGKTYPEGLIQGVWNSDHPIDLVCYSLGAPTARYLQHLLIIRDFKDENGRVIETNGDWVRSITTLMGTNNGSHAVHMIGLGMKVLEPIKFSILWMIFVTCYLVHWIFGPWLDHVFPLSVEHWNGCFENGIIEALRIMPLLSENAGKDLSPKQMYHLNKEMSTTLPHPSTYYLACVAVSTEPISTQLSSLHRPSKNLLSAFPETLILSPFASMIGLFGGIFHRYSCLPEFGKKIDWRGAETNEGNENKKSVVVKSSEVKHALNCNDGIVSVAGQCHPAFEKSTSMEYANSFSELSENPEKGIWHHLKLRNWNHMQFMKRGTRQRLYLKELISFLAENID